jgi:uroporphyrinogen III methyltransferase / synthase
MTLGSDTVILTRSKEGNAELSARLKELGLSPVAVDTLSFSPPSDWSRVDASLSRLKSFDWLVLTSATGARYFAGRANHLGLPIPWPKKPYIAAVGPKTASAVAALGLKPKFVPTSFRTSSLADELPLGQGLRVLLLRADIADRGMVDRLEQRGFRVEASAIYSTATPRARGPRDLGDARFVVFASPSAVRGLCSRLSPEEISKLRRAKVVCIGPVTEAAAKELGFSDTVVPKVFTLDSVVQELVTLVRRGR